MKKLLFLLIAVLSMTICFVGCNKTPTPNVESVKSEPTIEFTESDVVVEIYENFSLHVQGAGDNTISWRSSNPEKLTVDQNGVLFAKIAGTVTVYASDGINEISCLVTVANSGYIPILVVATPSVFTLAQGDIYNLTPYVSYNGVKYNNAEYEYSATGSVSVSSSGVITANSVGTGTVIIKANWNGVEIDTLSVELEITVI